MEASLPRRSVHFVEPAKGSRNEKARTVEESRRWIDVTRKTINACEPNTAAARISAFAVHRAFEVGSRKHVESD